MTKNLFLSFLSLFLSFGLSGQSFKLLKDDMTDEEYLIADKREITYKGDSKTQGVVWSMSCDKEDSKWVANGLSLRVYGLGCLENVEVIIMFEDGTKITSTQWNKFNCDEDVWTNLSASEINMLKTLPIKKIRVTNKYNFESYDFLTVSPEMRVYYNKLLLSLENGNANGFDIFVEKD